MKGLAYCSCPLHKGHLHGYRTLLGLLTHLGKEYGIVPEALYGDEDERILPRTKAFTVRWDVRRRRLYGTTAAARASTPSEGSPASEREDEEAST